MASGLMIRPISHLLTSAKKRADHGFREQDGYADDVSHLNLTPIDSNVDVTNDSARMIVQLRELILYSKKHSLSLSIAGAKHSMGGHTISPNGVRVNMLPYHMLRLDTLTGILRVGSGALWSEVIPYLNQYGRAVQIMQSDNAFSVGGSVSVNCHGWQHNKPPIASSVISFRLLKADGSIATCSRIENKELFSLALGGYGLFGIILDLKLQTVPNEIYSFHRLAVASEKYISFYNRYVDKNEKARMVYGRLSVNKDAFLQKAMLNFFEFERTAPKNFPLPEGGFTEFKRTIFLGTKEDDYGKELRWNTEQVFTKIQIGSLFSRNEIMNESPALYLNRDSSRTDILHEYFIPKRNFMEFIKALQRIVPQYQTDLLNITIRNVYEDKDTYLRYAREEVFAFVMFFNQARTKEAETQMTALTQSLIKAADELNGTYYLPYRLHATREQFNTCYPMAPAYFKKKRVYDPEGIFGNMFWERYAK
jgi:hypothetical protein